MAHNIFGRPFGIGDMLEMVAAHSPDRPAFRRAALVLLAIALLVCSPRTHAQNSTFVPAVIASSVSPVPTTTYALPLTGNQTNLISPSEVAVDACGNIYTLDHGYDGSAPITEIPAGGGAAYTVDVEGNTYGVHMGQDQSNNFLLVNANYGTHANLIPLVNCVAQSSQTKTVGGGPGALYYYYNPGAVAGDFLGNIFITTNGTCCVTGNYYLIEEINGTGNILLANQPNEILSPAIDKLQNVYFITGAAVYELPFSGGQYAKVPIPFGKYLNPVGLSMDSAGNLYVADSSAGAIYEIPAEGTTGPNLADQFVVASHLNINVAAAINARGDMYYTAATGSAVLQLSLGNANFRTLAIGETATRILNFQFNLPATLTSIQGPGGDYTLQAAAVGTTPCVAGTAYGPAATSSCQITVGFKPGTVGKQSSAVVLTYTVGAATKTINAFVEGVGQGALLTLDPGTVTPAGTGFSSPAGVAVDRAGNTFIADIGKNAVMEFPVGGGPAISVATQSGGSGVTLPLSAPAGVAVDGAGNVFIADTGNNRVVEVPSVNGVLKPAGSTVIASGLKSPASVFVHTNGDLYVADTGNNTILVYPSFNGPSNAGAAFGAPTKLGIGLSAPLAVTVDGPGNIYIADSGNNQILEYPLGGGQATVAANILNPSALTTDSSGSLFVVDQGNFRVLRIPSVQGTLNPNDAAEVGLAISNPYGLAIDASSNLYVTDRSNASGYTITRSQIGLVFGNLAVGTPSTALPLTVESAGNLPLVFNSPYFTETGNAGDFAMTSPTGACANALTLPTGASCDLVTTFTPTVAGARSATVTFTSNAANAPQLTVTGTGVSPSPTTTTLALIPAVPGAPFYGEKLSFTATIAPTSGSGTPTGFVSFVLDGTQIALLPVVKGVATLQLNSGLTGGLHTIYAAYKGDAADNASSSSVMSVTIARAPTNPILTITKIPFNNPYSLRHSNTGSCNVTDSLGYTNQFPAIQNDQIGFSASVTSPGIGVPSGTLTFFSDGKLINGAPPPAPTLTLVAGGGTLPNNQTVYVLLTLTGDFGETAAGAIAKVTTTALNAGVSVALASSYGPAATGVKVYEADVAAGSAAPSTFHLVDSYALSASITPAVILTTATGATPLANNTSSASVLPITGGVFSGSLNSDANTLGDGTIVGENNVLLGSHVITVVYSGDKNYLPSTSTSTTVTVTDVGPTTPVILPQTPVSPAPYCDASSTITGSRPSDPSTFTVAASSSTISASATAPGTVTLTISSLAGFTGFVDFACPDLPQYTTCSTNPGQATINPSTPGQTLLPSQVVLTVTTNVPPYVPTAKQGGFFWLASVVLGFLMIFSRRRFQKAAGSLTIAGLALLLFGGISGLSGCGSSTTSAVVTKPGAYPITVVMTGSRHDNYGYNEVFRADLPYSMVFTLNVK